METIFVFVFFFVVVVVFFQKMQFFCIVGTYFSTNASFRVVERIFWLVQTISLFPSSRNVFFNETFIPAIGEGFSLYWKHSTLLESSFLPTKTVTDMSGNHFLKTDLILASRNSFSS